MLCKLRMNCEIVRKFFVVSFSAMSVYQLLAFAVELTHMLTHFLCEQDWQVGGEVR